MAIVGIPHTATNSTRIEANGTSVWHNGERENKVHGLTFLENTADYITFSVEPGKWSFKANSHKPNNVSPFTSLNVPNVKTDVGLEDRL